MNIYFSRNEFLIKTIFLGPVPTFFSNNPEATLEELKKKPEFGFQCLQTIVSKLLARGELTRYTVFKSYFVLLLLSILPSCKSHNRT